MSQYRKFLRYSTAATEKTYVPLVGAVKIPVFLLYPFPTFDMTLLNTNISLLKVVLDEFIPAVKATLWHPSLKMLYKEDLNKWDLRFKMTENMKVITY